MKKKLLIGAVLSLLAINVNAATADFSYGPTKILDVHPDIGSFNDSYTFELTSLSKITYSVLQINDDDEGFSYYNFSSFSYGLFDNFNTQITDSSSLAAGIYTLKISGVTSGDLGGYYRINGNVSVIPVPEPDTSTMALFGLSLIGLVALRKSI